MKFESAGITAWRVAKRRLGPAVALVGAAVLAVLATQTVAAAAGETLTEEFELLASDAAADDKFGRAIEGKSETISRREACEELPLLQALTLAQLVAAADADTNKSPINFRQRWLIDGAGKSNEELAWRYRLAEDQQELYAWFGVTSRRHGLESMLHKVAANRDNELGAVRFEQWQSIGGFQLPKRITFVESLAETELLRIETLDVSWTDAMLTFEQQEDNVDE